MLVKIFINIVLTAYIQRTKVHQVHCIGGVKYMIINGYCLTFNTIVPLKVTVKLRNSLCEVILTFLTGSADSHYYILPPQ